MECFHNNEIFMLLGFLGPPLPPTMMPRMPPPPQATNPGLQPPPLMSLNPFNDNNRDNSSNLILFFSLIKEYEFNQ